MGMIEIKEEEERVILVAVSVGDEDKTADSLEELEELAKTAGVFTVAKVMQNRSNPDPGTYVGKGKIEEIREMLHLLDATGIICDDELSPAQMNNLAEMLDCKVCDRTLLILDIFAARARTSEGKIQVELAQLRYRQARLVGLRRSLSRLGGGIGTRGPGEKKLEMDRRLISERISALRQELETVQKHRELIRRGREKGGRKTVAIVGYTNAGKSTLLNTLTSAGVLEEDALFATLDPTTRMVKLPGGSEILLTDTVGFIRKLPHQLIEAFKSTLEEVVYADMILHVADLSNPQVTEQMQVVYDTLRDLHAGDKPVITFLNKTDRLQEKVVLHDFQAEETVYGSARTGEGLALLEEKIEAFLLRQQIYIERIFPYTEAGKAALIRSGGHLVSEEYLPEGISVKAYVPADLYGKL